MQTPQLKLDANTVVDLPAHGGMPESAHVIEQESIDAVHVALATGRPLLVRGEPGTGKSQLARVVAKELNWPLVHHSVDSRTETRDLLWSVDAVARLAEAQVLGAAAGVDKDRAAERIAILNFVHPGVLWWAFDWRTAEEQAIRSGGVVPNKPAGWAPDQGVVVLVDEIDKADRSVPNGLLDALGHGRFDVLGRPPVEMQRASKPLILITTNEERAVPDAFLRRCFVLHLDLPEDPDALRAYLLARGRAHLKKCAESVLQRAADQVIEDRKKMKDWNLSAPGVAEYIDLLHAVTELRSDEAEQRAFLDRIRKFALQKHGREAVPG